MKKTITVGLLLISNLIYSQSIQISNDDEFSFKANNQSFVLFKIRVIDKSGYYTSEQIENGHYYCPSFRIMKFDALMIKKWDTQISTRPNINERIKGGLWTKKGDNTVYEWLYLLETNPRESGYFFESLSFIAPYENVIPILRKIAPENNRLYNYGTIEITVNQPDKRPFYRLLNDKIEKENIINEVMVSYPNIFNAYKDKISDERLKFFFAITTTGELNLKNSYDYWSNLTRDGIDGQFGSGITINSKKYEQSLQTLMSFKEIMDLPLNFDITYRSEWTKGEMDRPYGLIVGNSDINKYFYYIKTNGKSGIEGTSNGTNEVSEFSTQDAAFPGKLNKENDYKIEVRNKKTTYYINNIKIGTFDLNDDLSKACFIGFLVKDKQKVHFDDLQIIEK